MDETGERSCWRTVGVACMMYGAGVAVVTLLVVGMLSASPTMAAVRGLAALVAAVGAALGVHQYRHHRHTGLLAPRPEGAVMAVSVPLSPLLLLVGLLLAISDRYTGIEKWLPDVQDRDTYEMTRVQRAVSRLELPRDVHDRAVELLGEIRDKGLMKAYPPADMIGGVVYIAAKDAGDPRTLDEVADAAGTSRKRVGRAYRYIGRNTDIRVLPPQPEDHVARFADMLELDEDVAEHAREIIADARDAEILSGKSPTGIAAAALFVAARMAGADRTLKDVADTLGVTTITVRSRSRDLIETLELDVEKPGD